MIRKVFILMAGVLAMMMLWAGAANAQSSPASVLPSSTVQPAQVQGEQLARTGQDVTKYVVVGSALAGAGVVLVVTARRRQRRHATLS